MYPICLNSIPSDYVNTKERYEMNGTNFLENKIQELFTVFVKPASRLSLGILKSIMATAAVLGLVLSGFATAFADDASTPAAAAATCTESVPFMDGEGGYPVFRGPVLLNMGANGIMAFATAQQSATDESKDNIVNKISTDGGCTWSALHMTNPSLNGESHSSPVPFWVPDNSAAGGHVVLLSSYNAKRVFIQTSTNVAAGEFSAPVEITSQIMNSDMRMILLGQGHGIVLKNGPHAGRLVGAAGYTAHDPADSNPSSTYYGAMSYYSDNGGVTWQKGFISRESTINLNETNLTEIGSVGNILYTSRDQYGSAPGNRAMAVSSDGGESVTAKPWTMTNITTAVCSGSVITVNYKGSIIPIFNGPINGNRSNQTIWSVDHDVNTWSKRLQVSSTGGRGYSDMVNIDTDTIGVMWEGVAADGTTQTINFKRIAIGDIFKVAATASNVYSANYNASKAVDGDFTTRWATSNGINAAWLELDYGVPTTFNQALIDEWSGAAPRVTGYSIQYWDGSVWQDAYTGTTIGNNKSVTFNPVTASRIRLNITSVTGTLGPTINEFQLYNN